MKKFSGVQWVLFFALLFCSPVIYGQTIQSKQLTVEEAKKLSKEKPLENYIKAVPNTQEKERLQVLTAYLYKAVLHRSDKKKYPINNNDKMEKRMAEIVAGMPEKAYQHASDTVQLIVSDKSKLSNSLGKYSEVVFANSSLGDQLRAKGATLEFKESATMPTQIKDERRIDVLVDGVYCVDETNPESGTDRIVMNAAFAWGSTAKIGNGFYCGRFNDGAYGSYGGYELGSLKYSMTGDFPRTWYALFMLVEANQNETDAVRNLESALQSLVTIAVSASQPIQPEILQNTVAGLIRIFTDDNVFPPCTIIIEARSPLDVYVNGTKVAMPNGTSDVWTLSNFTAHGGIYQVFLKFRRS